MSCSSPGATHWFACPCREAEWAAKLAAAEARCAEMENREELAKRIAARVLARADRYEAALREIARRDSADEPESHATLPLDSCPSCIARASLAGGGK